MTVLRTARTAVLLLAGLVPAACSVGTSSMRATFTDSELGQVYMRTLDSDRIAIAFYRAGELAGAAEAHRLDHSWANDWLRSHDPVDPPELPVWRQSLRRMRRLAETAGDDPDALLFEGRDLPFSHARRDCLQTWVGNDPERAARLLDRLADADLGPTADEELVELALVGSRSDARLAGWMAAFAADNSRAAARRVAAAPGVGPETARVTLRELDEFSANLRHELFDAVAPRLGRDLPERDRELLLRAIDRLPSSDEAAAILRLLERPAATAALGRDVLRALEDFRSSDRLDVLLAAARLARGDRAGADAIGRALDDLPSRDRWPAAETLLREGADAELVVALLREAHTLPTRDRARIVEAALDQAHWDDRIEVAAQAAVADVASRDRRNQLRQAVEARATKGGGQQL